MVGIFYWKKLTIAASPYCQVKISLNIKCGAYTKKFQYFMFNFILKIKITMKSYILNTSSKLFLLIVKLINSKVLRIVIHAKMTNTIENLVEQESSEHREISRRVFLNYGVGAVAVLLSGCAPYTRIISSLSSLDKGIANSQSNIPSETVSIIDGSAIDEPLIYDGIKIYGVIDSKAGDAVSKNKQFKEDVKSALDLIRTKQITISELLHDYQKSDSALIDMIGDYKNLTLYEAVKEGVKEIRDGSLTVFYSVGNSPSTMSELKFADGVVSPQKIAYLNGISRTFYSYGRNQTPKIMASIILHEVTHSLMAYNYKKTHAIDASEEQRVPSKAEGGGENHRLPFLVGIEFLKYTAASQLYIMGMQAAMVTTIKKEIADSIPEEQTYFPSSKRFK